MYHVLLYLKMLLYLLLFYLVQGWKRDGKTSYSGSRRLFLAYLGEWGMEMPGRWAVNTAWMCTQTETSQVDPLQLFGFWSSINDYHCTLVCSLEEDSQTSHGPALPCYRYAYVNDKKAGKGIHSFCANPSFFERKREEKEWIASFTLFKRVARGNLVPLFKRAMGANVDFYKEQEEGWRAIRFFVLGIKKGKEQIWTESLLKRVNNSFIKSESLMSLFT